MATSPLNFENLSPSTSIVYEAEIRNGFKQSPITTAPLAYKARFGRFNKLSVSGPAWQSTSLTSVAAWSGTANFTVGSGNLFNEKQAYNRAYAKFVGKMKDQAETLVTLGERRQAYSMMTTRLAQIAGGALRLRRGDLSGFYDAFRIAKRYRRDIRRLGRDVSGIFLEFHFGWTPLVNDVFNSIKIIESSFPTVPIEETGSSSWEVKNQTIYSPGLRELHSTVRGLTRAKIGATVSVSDLTLAKSNALGLINPATVAWELVPFSFVVDWFAPIGPWLPSFTDFLGFSVTDAYNTAFVKSQSSQFDAYDIRFSTKSFISARPSIASMRRSVGVGSPYLVPNQIRGLSPTRGAVALSLLLQRIKSLKP